MNNPVRKPKAPLSAYNLYFQVERKRILNGTDHLGLCISHEEVGLVAAEHKAKDGNRPHRRTHGRIGFKELARVVAHRWKALDRATKSLLEHHARLQKLQYKELFEAYMTTEEYQLELQAKQLERSLEANPYHQEGVSAAKPNQNTAELFPDFHFQKTVALVQPVSKEPGSKPQGHVWLPSEEAKSHSSSRFSFRNPEDERGQTGLEDYSYPKNSNDAVPPCSVSIFQWDAAIHQQEDPEAHEPKNLISSETDLAIMAYMVDFHLSMFSETSSMSDLFDTSALNEIDQAEELFDM